MAAVTVAATFRPNTRVFAYRIPDAGGPAGGRLAEAIGSGTADANGTVAITGLPAGPVYVIGESLDLPPLGDRQSGFENPARVKATAA
jgi:hypothetical protein